MFVKWLGIEIYHYITRKFAMQVAVGLDKMCPQFIFMPRPLPRQLSLKVKSVYLFSISDFCMKLKREDLEPLSIL